ncbi:3-demethylubiquinone-9 3-methyltransferase [Saccharomonospora azurea SZMC 14600]|uniref:VOC family protein n=1 Tax=Saccharomonospora azurea TaxID=40988 RepID=UPI00023FEDFD|nr:VOC family protein [Saccharomonospora azurea]EHK83961.1 3-demethylubiquinone-9 3-methyltransferase [Saccharomonospora azurea SZMC 14600]
MDRIATCLWYSNSAEEAVRFYGEVFPDLRVHEIARKPGGDALVVLFELRGQHYMALNGGPNYSLSPAASIYVPCTDQAEVDRLWSALTAGGTELQCGWLTDAYGLTWQVVPSELPRLLTDPDPAKAERAQQALLPMRKIDIATIRKAVTEG